MVPEPEAEGEALMEGRWRSRRRHAAAEGGAPLASVTVLEDMTAQGARSRPRKQAEAVCGRQEATGR